MRAGEIVLLRSIFGGNVRWCCASRYVGKWDDRHTLYCQPGDAVKALQRAPGVGYAEIAFGNEPLRSQAWSHTHVLRFVQEGERHMVEIFWDESWTLVGWYVNLQAPLVVNGRCFDTTDHALDIVVEPDGTWRWKDEDELDEAVARGIWTEAEAAEIRAEGERVIEAAPWPTGWEDWRPPAGWGPLGLPRDWHVV